ncbi:uncharacterized protein LOC106673165 [Cimex lectularius]|uniref:Uncharacterized protein n=1 Tax=Cimex lectularius TaxID=79782 RepID=A0A8I6SAZ3_CIMLE|nr:uncharacterized protein LOC106673165 [Cimex lectularius]XP_024083907.1 uncharacterized protein LOC106673165 [Cimex lectularius]
MVGKLVNKENAYDANTPSVKKNVTRPMLLKRPLLDVKNTIKPSEQQLMNSPNLKLACKSTVKELARDDYDDIIDDLKYPENNLIDDFQDILPSKLLPTHEELNCFVLGIYPPGSGECNNFTNEEDELFFCEEPDRSRFDLSSDLILLDDISEVSYEFMEEDDNFH